MPRLSVALIRLDGGTQTRAEIDDAVVEDYAGKLREGVTFPPVVVFHDGSAHWLADGFHRVTAAKTAMLPEVDADVRQGTRRDAILYSVGANAAHGLRRTNADKRRAVQTLLRDEEWAKWPQTKIAQTCGVSREYVSRVFGEVKPSCDRSHDATRTVVRNGVTYQQNTANIGKAPKPEPTPAPKPAPGPACDICGHPGAVEDDGCEACGAAPVRLRKPRAAEVEPVEDEEEDGDDAARAGNPDGLVFVEPEPEPEPERKPRGWGEHDLALYVGDVSAIAQRFAAELRRRSANVDPRWRDEARESVAGVLADAIDAALEHMPATGPRRAALSVIAGGKK